MLPHPQPGSRSVAKENFAIVVAICVALLLRIFRLDHAAYWYDEIVTVRWILLPWAEMIQRTLLDNDANHLPTYFVLLKGWSLALGTSPWALRFMSVVLSGASVFLISRMAGLIAGANAAVWAAWVAAVSPYLIHHAQEARMYPLLACLAAGSTLILTRYLAGKDGALRYSFVLCSWGLMLTHYYGLVYVGGLMLVLPILRRKQWREWRLPFSLVSVGMLLVTYLGMFVAGRSSGATYDIDWLAFPGVLWSMLSGYTLLPTSETLHAEGARAVLPYLPFALLAIPPLLLVIATGARRIEPEFRVLLGVTLAAALMGPFAVSFVFSGVSLNPRYFVSGAPVAIVLLAAGTPRPRRPLSAGTVAFFVTVAVMILATTLHLVEPGHGRVDVYGAGRWLDENVDSRDEILVTSVQMARLAQFHWSERRFRLYPAAKTVAAPDNARQLARAAPAPDQSRVCQVFGRAWLSDPQGALQEALIAEHQVESDVRFRGIRILCWRSDADISDREF